MKSGFVAVVGRPNVGKSSLTNRIVGARLGAVSERPQTTWHQIRGILTDDRGQIVFVDTPGMHRSPAAMNRAMLAGALEATLDADAVMVLLDATALRGWERQILDWLEGRAHVLLVLNKIDLLSKDDLAAVLDRVGEWPAAAVIPVSAVTGDNVDHLVELLFEHLPEGPLYYPEDDLTDRPVRFLATEYIRQAVFEQLSQELPYSTFAEIEEWRQEPDKPLYVGATIYIERPSQKQILIGTGGRQIREVGKRARQLIQELTGEKVFLDLWVKVLPKWTKKEHHLRRAGLLMDAKRLRRVERLMQRVGSLEADGHQ